MDLKFIRLGASATKNSIKILDTSSKTSSPAPALYWYQNLDMKPPKKNYHAKQCLKFSLRCSKCDFDLDVLLASRNWICVWSGSKKVVKFLLIFFVGMQRTAISHISSLDEKNPTEKRFPCFFLSTTIYNSSDVLQHNKKVVSTQWVCWTFDYKFLSSHTYEPGFL